MVEAVRNASSWITGTKGGYVRFRPEKAPSEILIMDKPSVADAQKFGDGTWEVLVIQIVV